MLSFFKTGLNWGGKNEKNHTNTINNITDYAHIY